MPLIENLPLQQKAAIYDFWAAAFQGVGIEPVVTQNPSSWLFLDKDSTDLNQVEALRAIADKYLRFADQLEAEIRRLRPVVPQNGDEPEAEAEDDMPPPLVRSPAPAAPRRRARAQQQGVDGRGGPAPAPVKPRVRGER